MQNVQRLRKSNASHKNIPGIEEDAPPGAELPVDSDLDATETPTRAPRPVHLTWQFLAVVAAGGAIGTSIRELLSLVIPPWGSFPAATFLINIFGAFVLGALLESLVRRGPDEGRKRSIRLFVGTGILGGFTTYSSLATDTALRLQPSQMEIGLLYAVATLLVGGLATWAGISSAGALHRRIVTASPGRGDKP
jgi:CrcB protein